jgi:hypothetical protein
MKDPHDDHPNAPLSKDDALKHAPADASGDSGDGNDSEPIDIVDAEVISDPRPDRKGRQGAALRRGTEKKRVRGYQTRRRLIDLHVFGGKRLKECAYELGISYGRAHAVWRTVVAEAHGAHGTKDEHLQAVRGYLDCHYRRLIEESQPRLAEGAAYGAVVVQACKALADLHDLKAENPQPQGLTLEDVGREVRVVSPLLLDRLDKLRELSGQMGTQSQPDVPGLSLGGVPVEGTAKEPVADSGAKSPLLEGSAAERMLRGLEREGDRVVERAQLEGADAALDAMPVKRKSDEASKAQGCDTAGRSPSSTDEEKENE